MRVILTWTLLLAAFCAPAAAVTLDEEPAGAGDWGYRPNDGEMPALNPPGFSWRPCKDADSYTLQIARDKAFSQIVYEKRSTPWSAHCPSEVLPEGKLYWRYAARDTSGAQTPWSTVRGFTVNAEAVAFPQPTVEELIERMPREHPRLFFRPEDIPRLRELAAGPLAKQWAALLAHADKTAASPPDTSEPPKYPKEVKRGDGEWKKIWWGNRRRVVAVANSAATLGFAYRISGDEKYGQAARDLVMAMTKWDVDGATNLFYNDEAGMPALYYTARAYSWAYPCFSESDRATVIEMMRARGEQAFRRLTRNKHLWHPYNSHSNRLWHWLGEVAIAFQGEIPEADTALEYAMTIFYCAYPVWGDSDGGWHEGTGYWASYTSRFMYWAAVMRSAFGIDVFERPFYNKTGDYGLYNLPPGSERLGFGDQATSSSGIRYLMGSLAAGARNPYWQWYAETTGGTQRGGYEGFLQAADAIDLEAKAAADLPTSACFHGVGLALMNTNLLDGTDNIQVQFKSSPFGTQSHGYNANNAFLLNMNGKRVLLRSGKRDMYGSAHHKNWMWHTKSDNAITVNGESQIRHSRLAKGRITAFETTPAIDTVAGEAGGAYENLDRWTRRLVFLKPYAIVIHDVLEAPEPSMFQFMLHSAGPFEVNDSGATWSGDGGSLEVRFLTPDGLRVSQTGEFDPPPAEWAKFELNEWHLTAETTAMTADCTYLTVILLNGAAVNVERDGNHVTLTRGDETIEAWASPEALRLKAPGYERTLK